MRISDWSSDVCSSDLTEALDFHKVANESVPVLHIFRKVVEVYDCFQRELDTFVENHAATIERIQDTGGRKQLPFDINGHLSEALARPLQLLRSFLELAFQGRKCRDWSILWSDPGCLTQIPHTDFNPPRDRKSTRLNSSH